MLGGFATAGAHISEFDVGNRHFLEVTAIAFEKPYRLMTSFGGVVTDESIRFEPAPTVALFDGVFFDVFDDTAAACGVSVTEVGCRNDFLAAAFTLATPQITTLIFADDLFRRQLSERLIGEVKFHRLDLTGIAQEKATLEA